MSEHIEITAQEVRSAITRMAELIERDPARCGPELIDMASYGSRLATAATLAIHRLRKAA